MSPVGHDRPVVCLARLGVGHAILLTVFFCSVACCQPAAVPPAEAARPQAPPAVQPPAQPTYTADVRTPRQGAIRPSDLLDVYVAGEPSLSGQFPVNSEGRVKLPDFLGVFNAAGTDTAQLAAQIAERARKYLVEPTVVVSIIGRPPAFVSVLGEVARQGTYELDRAPTLLALLAHAGGVLPTGDTSQIIVIRAQREIRVTPRVEPGTEVIPRDVTLQEGDTVVVPRKPLQLVTVAGGVKQPGYYPVEQARTVSRALLLAGGATTGSDLRRAFILRGAERIEVDAAGVLTGDPSAGDDAELRDKDVLVVPLTAGGGILGAPELVVLVGAVARPGLIPLTQAQAAGRSVVMSGGFAPEADPAAAYILRAGKRVDVNLREVLDGHLDDTPLEPNDIIVVPTLVRDVVHVVGGVARPGPFLLAQTQSLARAIMLAGGLTPMADEAETYILRDGQRLAVNLQDILSGRAGPDVALQPNDLIVVPLQTGRVVAVSGSVLRPGVLPAAQATSVARAIALTGGVAPTADLRAAYILRADGRYAVDLEAALTGNGPDPELRANDMLMVPEQARLPVFVAGAVVQPGAQPVQLAGTAAKAIGLAGGLAPQADARHAHVLRNGTRHELDAQAIVEGRHDFALQPNDLLIVPLKTAANQFAQSVLMLGAVARPGMLPAEAATSARKALSMAGGFAPTANAAGAYLLRGEDRVAVNLEAVMAGRQDDFALVGGDVVVVPERLSEVIYVVGAVSTAGPQPLSWSETLVKALAYAGVLPTGDLSGVHIFRGRHRIDADAERVLQGDEPDHVLEANDLVVVPLADPTMQMAAQSARSVTVLGAVARPGLLAPEQAATVAKALAWSGGPTPQADLEHSYLLRDSRMIGLDLRKLEQGRDTGPAATELRAGDALVLPALTPELAAAQQVARSVLVVGAVAKPGLLEAEQALSAGRAIILAGGAVEGADLAGTYILRNDRRVSLDLRAVMEGAAPDVPLEPRDVLVVPAMSRETVFIAGAVRTPGPVVMQYAHDAAQAVTIAGGATPEALLDEIYVLRKGRRLPVNLQGEPLLLQANDLVFVPARAQDAVYVAGAVEKPGPLPLHQAISAAGALQLAGGARPLAELEDAYILRGGERIAVDLTDLKAGSPQDLPLSRDDVLIVPTIGPEPVYVVGNVKTPGAQPLARAGTAAKALMMAGGAVDDIADLKGAYVLRGSERVAVDLDAVVNQGRADADIALQAHDAVVVPKLDDQYIVLGQVAKPGPYALNQADTALAAISIAGGPLPMADLAAATILRDGGAVPVDLEAIIEHREYARNVALAPGDTLIVPRRTERIFIFGAVGQPGAYPFSEGESFMDLIAKAGGIGPGAAMKDILVVRAKPREQMRTAASGDRVRRERVTRPAPPASAPTGPDRSLGARFNIPRDSRARDGDWPASRAGATSPAGPAAAGTPDGDAKENFHIAELAKLDPQSVEGRPQDGDLVYVPAVRMARRDVWDYVTSILSMGRWFAW